LTDQARQPSQDAAADAGKLSIQNLLSAEELERVRARSDLLGVFYTLNAWAWIAGAMALFAWWPNPLTFLIGVMIVGGRQLGLAVLMHDAAHRALTRSAKLNDFLGQWLAAKPLGVDMPAYRAYHLKHHAHVQSEKDPDLGLSAPFPITRESLRRKIVRDLTGQTFWKQRKAQFLGALGPKDRPLPHRLRHLAERLGPFYAINLALLAGLSLLGHWYLYFLLWLLPLATWNMMITRVRNIAEHACVPKDEDPFLNARTTYADPVTRLVLAPYWVNYHVEHHMFMWVPCYRLPALHKMLIAKGYGPRMEIRPNYLSVLKIAAPKTSLPKGATGLPSEAA